MGVEIEKLEVHRDPRGFVFEPLEPHRFADQRNAHVVVTEPGGVRGNHRHRRGTERMAVEGPALVRIREDAGPRDVRIPGGEVWRFTFPPGVAHAVQNTGDAPGLLVAFNTEPHDPDDPDVVRDELIRPGE